MVQAKTYPERKVEGESYAAKVRSREGKPWTGNEVLD
jgi:hypothetical protein